MTQIIFVWKRLSVCFVLTALLLGLAACSGGGKIKEHSAKEQFYPLQVWTEVH